MAKSKVTKIKDMTSKEYQTLRSKPYMPLDEFVKQGHYDEVNKLLEKKDLKLEIVENAEGNMRLYGVSKL